MDDSAKKAFQSYVQQRFPPESKRGTSGVYYEAFGEKIKAVLQGCSSEDRNFRFWIRKKKFQLLDIPSLGAKNVLIVPVKEKEVGNAC